MAHTLKAYYYTDPATAVTVDFYGAVTGSSGIAVDAYEMGVPGIDQARNSSLYSDTPRPVWSRHGTVTDTLTVTVRGSTNTVLYTNLHYLAKLGEYARKGTQNPYVKATPYLELKPGGSAAGEVLYAPIYDCRVTMPADWARSVDATLMIEDITVTIERGLWQAAVLGGVTTTNIQAVPVVGASSASSIADIGGDTSALYELRIAPYVAGTNITKFIVGYRSKAMGGANYASLGKKEAESQTMGTDTSWVADATASGGYKAQCTFATATLATRLSGTSIPYGTHRVFARMKATGSAVATVNVKYQDLAGTNTVYAANASVSVSSTAWYVYDLGVARYYESSVGAVADSTATGIWAIDALKASGAGNLDIDWVYFMPTEGYFTADGVTLGYTSLSDLDQMTISNVYGVVVASIIHVNVVGGVAPVQYTASFDPLPGPCALYWLIGTGATGTFDTPIINITSVFLYTNPRFLMPSEV